MPTPAYFTAPPFIADDILKLAEFAPAPLRSDNRPEEFAERLSETFRRALDWVAMSKQKASVEKFYHAISRHARGLLKALGLPDEDDPLKTASIMSRDDLRHAPGIMRMEQTHSAVLGWLTANRIMRGDYADTCYGLLSMISASETYLHGSDDSPRPGRPGHPPDSFREVLFNGLTWRHKEMFGRWPEIELAPGERNGRSVLWAKEVVLLAKVRIPLVLRSRFNTPEAEEALAFETTAINDLAELYDSTVADWLKKAAAFCRQHEAG